jgi:hypothetical protein
MHLLRRRLTKVLKVIRAAASKDLIRAAETNPAATDTDAVQYRRTPLYASLAGFCFRHSMGP